MVRPRAISRSPSAFRRQPLQTPLIAEKRSQFWWWVGGGSALLLCIALFFFYRYYHATAALKSLHDGIAAMQKGRRDEAIPFLERANAQIGSDTSAQGQLARLYLAEAYLQDGKLEEAKKLLEMESYQEGDSAYLSQILLIMVGRNAEKQNDLQSARKAYGEATALEGPFTEEALRSLVRVAEASGDSATARDARDKFLTQFANSPFASVMQQKLGR